MDAYWKIWYDFTFDVVDERGHCDLTLEMKRKYEECVTKAIDV